MEYGLKDVCSVNKTLNYNQSIAPVGMGLHGNERKKVNQYVRDV